MKKYAGFAVFAVLLLSAIIFLKDPVKNIAYPLDYEKEVFRYANEFDVPEELVFAVIKTESGFSKDAVSHRDAHGLMQITEDTFNWAKEKLKGKETFDEIFDPDVNIKYGTYILSFLLDDFKNEKTALAAYNAGRGNVKKWLGDKNYSLDGENLYNIPFKETREYVEKVHNSRNAYLKLYPNKFTGGNN